VTATLRTHPKDQGKLELMASRISMEKGVPSISWSAKEAEPTPERESALQGVARSMATRCSPT
jgi:hypothetical protein